MKVETLVAEDGWLVQEKRFHFSDIRWSNRISLLIVEGPGQLRWEFSNFGGDDCGWREWDRWAKPAIQQLIASDECPDRVKDVLILYTFNEVASL